MTSTSTNQASYRKSAISIRNGLSKFTKDSVLSHTLDYLHQPEKNHIDTAKKLPPIAFLLLEWLYQVDQRNHPRNASEKDINKVLNQIWGLQDKAAAFSDSTSVMLSVRKILIGQLWYQKPILYDFFTLVRLGVFLLDKNASPVFSRQFKDIHNIGLSDFLILSLWVLICCERGTKSISFMNVIVKLTPHFDLETIVRFFQIVGLHIQKMREFMADHEDTSVSVESYFSDSLFFQKPLIYDDNGILFLHHKLLAKSLAEFVIFSLKSADPQRFKDKFTKEFEKYVGCLLIEAGIDHIPESGIKKIYEDHYLTGKVVDFLVIQGSQESAVFIDAKGIEPNIKLRVSDNPKLIKDRLRKDFLYGVNQSYECANLLTTSNEIELPEYQDRFILVVTHLDYFFTSGEKMEDQIDPELFSGLKKKYGDQFSSGNIQFVCIEDFEGIIEICKESKTSIAEFLRFCSKMDCDQTTAKFDTRQHIFEYTKRLGMSRTSPIGSNKLSEQKELLFRELEICAKNNSEYWTKLGARGLPELYRKSQTLKASLS